MYTALIILHAITCLLLIGVVLIQSSKGAGLSGVFAADGGDSFMGAGTGNFLTKLTSILAVVFMITASSLAFLSVKRQRSVMANKAAPVVTEAQKQAFQKELARKMQEINEQAAADSEFTKETADTQAAPTVDDVIDQEQTLAVAVPEVKTPEIPAVKEEAPADAESAVIEDEEVALEEQVKAIEEKENISQVAISEEDASVSVDKEKEIEAALAKAQADQETKEA